MYIWLSYQRGATRFYRRLKTTKAIAERETERINTRGLRKIDSSHLVSERDVWSIIISADELVFDASFDFMVNFWSGHQHWICDSESVVQPANELFVAITIAGGKMPVEYIGNHEKLRSMSFEAPEKYSHNLA